MKFALLTASYSGLFYSGQYCTPALEHHHVAGIDAIDRGTRLALRDMKRLVRATEMNRFEMNRMII